MGGVYYVIIPTMPMMPDFLLPQHIRAGSGTAKVSKSLLKTTSHPVVLSISHLSFLTSMSAKKESSTSKSSAAGLLTSARGALTPKELL